MKNFALGIVVGWIAYKNADVVISAINKAVVHVDDATRPDPS